MAKLSLAPWQGVSCHRGLRWRVSLGAGAFVSAPGGTSEASEANAWHSPAVYATLGK